MTLSLLPAVHPCRAHLLGHACLFVVVPFKHLVSVQDLSICSIGTKERSQSCRPSLTMALTLVIPKRDSQILGSDSDQSATSQRTPRLRPTSWVNAQHEKQRSQELKRAKKEEEERQRVATEVKSETPMIDWTSALFRKVFRRDRRVAAGKKRHSTGGYAGC